MHQSSWSWRACCGRAERSTHKDKMPVRCHGKVCLCTLHRLFLQFLLWGRGTSVVARASLCIHFVVVMGDCCGLLLRSSPCLRATSICCFLALSQVCLVLSTLSVSWKLKPLCMAGCASCLLVWNNMMTKICRAPGGSDPTLVPASPLPNYCNSCMCPRDTIDYSLLCYGLAVAFVPKNRGSFLLLIILFLKAVGNLTV